MTLYKKIPAVVEARFLTEDTEIITLEGKQTAEAGQWLISGIDNDPYAISDGQFQTTYLKVEGEEGKYRKKSLVVEAVQLVNPMIIERPDYAEGMRGKAGDWFITNGKDQYFCDKDIFEKSYEPLQHVKFGGKLPVKPRME